MTTKITNSDETQATINYLRNDKLFRGKNISTTNLRKLFVGLAIEIARAENKLQEISDQYDPQQTTLLLDEWEKALGIPDDCIPLSLDNDTRREWILVKLSSLGVSTKEDFEYLGEILGYNLTVRPGQDVMGFPYIFPFVLYDENPKWIMIVEAPAELTLSVFPYTFPFIFTEDKTRILRCLFQALAPSNVKVIFNFG